MSLKILAYCGLILSTMRSPAKLRPMMRMPILTLLIGAFAIDLAPARADDDLDTRLAGLHAQVAAQFQAESVPGLPAPQMMPEDLFSIAMKSYCGLMESDRGDEVSNPDHFSIVDYTMGGKVARLFIYDVSSKRFIRNTWTSHGSNSSMYFYHSLAGLNLVPRGELAVGYHSESPMFFSNVPESGQSSVGMAIAANETYESEKVYAGIPVGTAVRMKGVDGGLNDKLLDRGMVIHGYPFNRDGKFGQNGAPSSAGCVMVDNSIAAQVRREMMGGPVMLYHDRLFPDNNEYYYRQDMAEMARLDREISLNLRTFAVRYSLAPAAVARAEKELKKELAGFKAKAVATYKYFKRDSKFITFDPRNPKMCAKRLGI